MSTANEKPRKALRAACKAIGIPFKDGYASAGGQVQKRFFSDLAEAIGMDRVKYQKLEKVALAQAILANFNIGFADNMESRGSRITDNWFIAIMPKLLELAGKDSFGVVNEDLSTVYFEGGLQTATHYEIERNSEIVPALKSACADRSGKGFIRCYSCRIAPGDSYLVEVIEAHHIVPVSVAGFRQITFDDFVLLCPNCHRALHAQGRLKKSS
jgi:hypothetical protein